MSAEDVTPRTPDRAVSRSALTRSADPWSAAPTSDQVPARSAAPIRDPDRYEILGEHGRGGLGRVSRAHDKDLGRDIAIKELLSRGHVNELRFAREAMITVRLEHPGIVPVHEAGRWPDGTPFYAMKLVSGRPLRSLIAERKTIDERIGLLHHVIAVADAIAYAHGRKIIHRDLKPANVIVGDFGETVVIDWGLAKDLSDATEIGSMGESATRSPDDQLTTAGSVLGTPAYMAPEQERGEAVDQRADVFAIGAMLWELCSLQKVPPMNLAHRHRMLRRAGIDRDLIVIIDKAIDPDPRSRYRDAGALAVDLKAFKSGARITARDYSLPAVLAHWTRRHRALAVALASFIVLLLGSVAGLAGLYRVSSRNAEDARRNASAAHDLLTQSYVEQGRRALLDGKHAEALAYLMGAAHRGDSPSAAFMRERAATPLAAEVLRIKSKSARMWSVAFSPDGRQLAMSDDLGAQVWDLPSNRLLFSLPHADTVFRVLYSPDGSKLITLGGDAVVKIWAAGTGALLHVLVDPAFGASTIYRSGAVSPDGRVVAALDRATGSAHVWSIETGALVASLSGRGAIVVSPAFSRDGQWFATTMADEVRVFDTASWKLARVLPAPQILRVCFDFNRPWLVTGSTTGDVSIWNVTNGERVRHLREIGEQVEDVACSRDGAFVAAAVRDGTSLVWRTESGELQARLENHYGRAIAIGFDSTSARVVTGGTDGRVVVSDIASGIPLASFEGPALVVVDVQFDPSSRLVAGAALDGTVRMWTAAASYRRGSSREIGGDCRTNLTERDQRFVAVPCTRHGVQVWDTAMMQQLAELPSSSAPEDGLLRAVPAVSSDGERAAISRGRYVEVYQLPGGRLLRTVQHAAAVTTIHFASHSHSLVTGSGDGIVLVSSEDGETRTLPKLGGAVDVAAFLPDGRVVVASADRRLTIVDVDRGAIAATLELPARINVLTVSSDGERMVGLPVVQRPTSPLLWDVPRARLIGQLEGHNSQVFSAQFLRDGHEILTAGSDGTARRWDGDHGLLRRTYVSISGVFDAAVSPDGKLVVGAGGDGVVRFWDASSGASLWTLRAHKTFLNGIHFEGSALITRGSTGEITRWEIPAPPASSDSLERFERLVRCGPLRFDPSTGGLVPQTPACDP